MTIGLATVDTASVARIAFVGIGVGGTLTLSRLAELADSSWSGLALDVVDRPDNLGRGSAFGSDIAGRCREHLSTPARGALSVASFVPRLA